MVEYPPPHPDYDYRYREQDQSWVEGAAEYYTQQVRARLPMAMFTEVDPYVIVRSRTVLTVSSCATWPAATSRAPANGSNWTNRWSFWRRAA